MFGWFSTNSRRKREEVRAEAQIDLRDGLLEARAERIAELERQVAELQAALAPYKTVEWMAHGIAHRRRLDDGPTAVLPSSLIRKPAEATAVYATEPFRRIG